VFLGVSFHNVMLMALGPGLGAAASVLFLARQPAEEKKEHEQADKKRADYKLPAEFYRFMAGVALFGMGDFSRSLLIYLAAKAFTGTGASGANLTWGMSGATFAVALFAVHNVVSAIAAYPAGHFSDRIPKKNVLIVGYALGAATNALLYFAYDTKVGMVCAVVLSGIYIAIEETVEKAAVASSLPKEKRTLGFGVLAGANAVGDMVSSIYVGLLLDSAHPERAFAVAAVLSFLGTAFIGLVAPRPKQQA
jgi:MFS family permease